MKVMVLGCGLMGPAAAYNAMNDPMVDQVVIADASPLQLDQAVGKLARFPHALKLKPLQLDAGATENATRFMRDCAVVISALPRRASQLAIRAAVEAGVPLVDLTRFDDDQLPEFARQAEARGGLVILGSGLEPGLTEIMARHLAARLDHVDAVHIQCGGVPDHPTPPLGYKVVFGGNALPFHGSDALAVVDGRLVHVPRYSGIEKTHFPSVGECEAWHEGFASWLLQLPEFQGLRVGTQKTVRYPGYAAQVTVLRNLGLLSDQPIEVDGVPVTPKRVVDAVLAPHVTMREGDRDVTLFRVIVAGEKDGRALTYTAEMIDRYDEICGFTSMARTTAFTAAIVGRMVARGELEAKGAVTPEQIVVGDAFDRLMRELAADNIHFAVSAA